MPHENTDLTGCEVNHPVYGTGVVLYVDPLSGQGTVSWAEVEGVSCEIPASELKRAKITKLRYEVTKDA